MFCQARSEQSVRRSIRQQDRRQMLKSRRAARWVLVVLGAAGRDALMAALLSRSGFRARQSVRRAARRAPPPDGIVGWLLAKQSEFYRGLSAQIRAAKTDGSAVWTLFALVLRLWRLSCRRSRSRQGGDFVLRRGEWRDLAARRCAVVRVRDPAGAGRRRDRRRRRGAARRDPPHHGRHDLVDRGVQLRVDCGARRAAALGQGPRVHQYVAEISCGPRRQRAAMRMLMRRITRMRRLMRMHAHAHDHDGHAHHDHAGHAHAHHSHGHDHKHGAACSGHHHGHDHDDHASAWGHAHAPEPQELAGPGGWKRGLSAIIAVGLRPCSGAILVLVFALAQGLFWAGVAATFIMGIGTAITVAAIADTRGRRARACAAIRRSRRPGPGMLVLRGLEVAAALLVLVFGIALLTRLYRQRADVLVSWPPGWSTDEGCGNLRSDRSSRAGDRRVVRARCAFRTGAGGERCQGCAGRAPQGPAR